MLVWPPPPPAQYNQSHGGEEPLTRGQATMRFIPLIALLLAVTGWVLTVLTGINALSGHFDERTCQTACMQGLFFGGIAAGLASVILGVFALTKPEGRVLTYLALALAVPLCGVFAALILIGNFA